MNQLEEPHEFEIVLDVARFRDSLRQLLLRPGQLAIGDLRTRTTVFCTELIIHDWHPSTEPIEPKKLPPFYALAVMGIAGPRSSTSDQLASAISPGSRQTLVAIIVRPDRADEIEATIVAEGRIHAPFRLHLVGHRLISMERSSVQDTFGDKRGSLQSILRASRTIGGLGVQEARAINRSSFIITGAGSGGSELARQLASLQPGHIAIVDSDHVGLENLNNLPHASYRDVQRKLPKVDSLLRALHRNQPDLPLTGIRRRIQDPETISQLDRMPRSSGLFSFVDNPGGRLAAGMMARQLFIPHLDIGTLIQFNDRGNRECRGDIRLFVPGIAAGCVACVPSANDFPSMLYSARSPTGTMLRGEPQPWNAERAGSLLHLNSSMVSQAIQLWLRYLRGEVSTHWVRALSESDSPLQFSESPAVGVRDCAVCGTVGATALKR